MPMPKLATLIGGLLLSRGGRRVAGRHAGKLALATLAWELWRKRQDERAGVPPRKAQGQSHPRQRWSGRRR
ncbi:MAG: cysteine protease [Alphaproteobacteria bacterium]|nr:cysteine protease [Alphaproteobacteria bacterium]MBU2271697.1 cysteine protease [Alphaproteobacteria bacterium]MBU2419735.1 cysteine protease [Alphaproteobacteria bacterium]